MKKSDIRVIALDLDGTLTNSEKKVSEQNKRALWEAADRGIHIALVSGRPILGIRHLAEELRLSENGGFVLACNGGQIIDCEKGETVFQECIPKELVPEITASARELGLHLIGYWDECIYSERPDGEYVKKESFSCGSLIRKINRLDTLFREEAPPKFIAADDPVLLRRVYPQLAERFSGKINLFFSEAYFLEFVPKDIDKAVGLGKLAAYLGIGPEAIMAMGDGYNDIPMMQYAGLPVAMGNAVEEVKQAAKAVTASNDKDGVAAAVRQYLF